MLYACSTLDNGAQYDLAWPSFYSRPLLGFEVGPNGFILPYGLGMSVIVFLYHKLFFTF